MWGQMKKHKPAQSNGKVAVAYLRVSTEDQNLGASAQRASIERWATANGVTVAAWFSDHGVSGATPVADRPALLDALAALTQHGAGVLVVAKRDRLARDVLVAAIADGQVKAAGAMIVSAAGEGDGNTPEAKLMRDIVNAIAEWERATIAARTRAALAVKKSRGERVGGIPYGKRADESTKILLDAPDECETIALARGLAADGCRIAEIGRLLTAGKRFPRQGRHWSHRQIVTMLA